MKPRFKAVWLSPMMMGLSLMLVKVGAPKLHTGSKPARRLLFPLLNVLLATCLSLRAGAQSESGVTPKGAVIQNTVVATIKVGNGPFRAAISPDDEWLYVVNGSDGTISVVNLDTKKAVGLYYAGPGPGAIVITPDGKKLYVCNPFQGTVTVIDAATGALINVMPVGTFPTDPQTSPDGKSVYVPNLVSGTISVIDTGTDAVINTITTGGAPSSVAFSPAGELFYVADSSSPGGIDVFERASSLEVLTVAAGVSPSYCLVNPQSANQLYVVDLTPTVAIVQDDVLVDTIQQPGYGGIPAVTPNGRFLYVPILATSLNPIVPGNTVVVYDTSTNTPVGNPITVGTGPIFVKISPDGKYAYVGNRSDNTVSIIRIKPAQ
jgi:YVTN family beta-propeller protein